MKKTLKSNKSPSSPLLDLHGCLEDEVFDKIEFFLKKHSAGQVRIMPGKGKGIVKKKLIEYLRLAHYAWSYEKLPNGSQN